MATFEYRGRTARGDVVTGELDAESADGVATQLFNIGVTPVDIEEVTKHPDTFAQLARRLGAGRPSIDDLLLFTRQMYALTKSGVPLVRGLTSLSESTRNMILREYIDDVVNTLQSGRDLAGSLARHPRFFTPMYINLIRVGENSGDLEGAFLRLFDYLSLERETKNRIKAALRYPITVIIAIAVALAIITIYVIPAFKHVFDTFGGELPLATRIILGVSDFAVTWWPVILATLAASVFGFQFYVRTDQGRYNWDKIRLRIPVVGDIVRRATLARFSRSFAMTFRSGVPLIQALTLVARALDNEYLGDRVLAMRQGIERGDSIYRTATASGMFTPLVLQMIAVGEESGRVDDMLDEAADFYEREVDYDIRNLSAAIEPILIVALGIMVLVLALGVEDIDLIERIFKDSPHVLGSLLCPHARQDDAEIGPELREYPQQVRMGGLGLCEVELQYEDHLASHDHGERERTPDPDA